MRVLTNPEFTFDDMIRCLEERENFSLSRWGDGEFMCMLKYGGSNTDKHKYFEDMGEELRRIINKGGKGELLALQSLAVKDLIHHEDFQTWLKNTHWSANAEILSRNHHRDNEFFEALNSRDVILVGNGYLREAPIRYVDFIEIPLVNCWLEHDNILSYIEPFKDCVIVYCASMMANVLTHELHSEDYTQIDAGSFFDPYCGRNTRRYHNDLNIF